jgi:hypothetical protein
MNFRSRKLTEELLSGAALLYSRVYSSFLQIPCEILNSNTKIICLTLQCLSELTYLNDRQLIDFNNEAISKFTGIPLGTVNRILADIETKISAANQWLQDNNFTERLSLVKIKQFGSATIYSYSHTEPQITKTFNAEISTETHPETAKPRKAAKTDADKKLKIDALLKTGFEKEDITEFLKYDIERINRNVKYYIDKYSAKGLENPLAMFKKTIAKDYGSTYLNETQRAAEYLKEIQKVIEIIKSNLTDANFESIKKAYKFDPPADPAVFKNKPAVKDHFKYKINFLPEQTVKNLFAAADAYLNYIKYESGFIGRDIEKLRELCRHAALQLIHNAVDFSKLENFTKAA